MVKRFKYLFSLIIMMLCVMPLVACGDTTPGDPPGTPPDTPPSGTQYGVWVDNSLADYLTVTLSKTQAYAGETITISYTVDPGYRVRWFDIVRSWQDEWGAWQNEVVDSVTDSFVMPEHNVTVWAHITEAATESVMTFEYDMPTDSYAITGWAQAFEQTVPETYDDGVHGEKPVTIIRTERQEGLDCVAVIRLPETITTIEEHRFGLPSYLKSINIPSSVTNFFNHETTYPIDINIREIINHSAYTIRTMEGKVVTESRLYKTSNNSAYFIVDDETELVAIKSQENMQFPNRGAILKGVDDTSKTTTLGNYDIHRYYCTDDKDIIKTITLGQGTIRVPELYHGPFLYDITLNQEIKEFGAMLGFSKIETLTLPDSLEYWGGMTDNARIRNINIGAGSKLKAITNQYTNNKNVALNEYQGCKYLPSEGNDYFMLVSIDDHTVPELHIHPSCKVIGTATVWGEPNEVMTELTIPASVRGISDGFLMYAYSLEKLNIEQGSCLEYIAYYYYEHFDSIIFPASITKLSGVLPEFSYFQAKNVELDIQEDPYGGLKIFYDIDRVVENDEYSYAVSHENEAYLTYWNEYNSASDLRTIGGYPIVYIGERVFEGNQDVYNVQLSNKLKYIGRFAFKGCTSVDIDTIDCPLLQYIGDYAFEDCYRINTIKIPKGCVIGIHSLPAVMMLIEDTQADFDALNGGESTVFTQYETQHYRGIARSYYECKEGGDYYYGATHSTGTDKQYALIKYLGNEVNVVPPAVINGANISIVAPFCYADTNIESIDVLSSDIGLDFGALYDAIHLTSVKALSISDDMFVVNLGDETLSTPIRDLEYIESNYFSSSSAASALLPSIETIIVHTEYGSINGCKATNITLPYLNNFLGEVFRVKGRPDFPPLEDTLRENHYLNVPSTLKNLVITSGNSVGNYHFRKCSNLESVVLGSSIASIGEYAFDGCTGLKRIEMPGVATVSRYSFYKCTSLQNVVFDYPLLTIHNDAFEGCTGLESITYSLANPNATFEMGIPDTCANKSTNFKYFNIVNTPHLDMSKLSNEYWNIIDAKTVSYSNVKPYKVAFMGTVPSGLKEEYVELFELHNKHTYYNFHENVIGVIETTNLDYLLYGDNKARIMKYTADGVASISIPGVSVEYIDDKAFKDSTITHITIPETVKYIGRQAFEYTTNLKIVSMSSGLEYIGWGAFQGSGITSITIPRTVTKLQNYAFSGCTFLSSVSFLSTLVTDIPWHAFSGCTALTSMHIPSQIKTIGDYAFFNTGLTSFTGIKESQLESIGEYAFVCEDPRKNPNLMTNIYICETFTSLEFPSTLRSIGKYAFSYCINLTSIKFNNGVTYIGSEAFYGNNITYLTLPDSLTDIMYNAFGGNENLTHYKGPVDASGTISFLATDSEYTSGLTHVEITSGNTISNQAFTKYNELKSVIIGDALWDFFYAGQYNQSINDNIEFLSIPCLMGSIADLNNANDLRFSGTLQIRGKEGFTGVPIGEDSLYCEYSHIDHPITFTAIDLSLCNFTDANVETGAHALDIFMPSTLERVSAKFALDATLVLCNPLQEAVSQDYLDALNFSYIVSEDVILDSDLWTAINVVRISRYYVYKTSQYDYIIAQNNYASVYIHYTDGITQDPDIMYWVFNEYGRIVNV